MNPRQRASAGLLGAGLAACGAAGAPRPPGPAEPLAPLGIEARRTPLGWELRVTPPRADTEGTPLPAASLRVAVFDAAAVCLGPPLVEGPPDQRLRLPPAAGSYDIATYSGRQLGASRRLDLPAWTPPPPAPDAPLIFRRADEVVELSWLPPSDPAAEVVVERDGQEVGRFAASVATLSDALEPRSGDAAAPAPPRYRLAIVGPDYRTAWSAAVSAP